MPPNSLEILQTHFASIMASFAHEQPVQQQLAMQAEQQVAPWQQPWSPPPQVDLYRNFLHVNTCTDNPERFQMLLEMEEVYRVNPYEGVQGDGFTPGWRSKIVSWLYQVRTSNAQDKHCQLPNTYC